MQILPLLTNTTQTSADAGMSLSADKAKRQAALFASLLGNATDEGTTQTTKTATDTASAALAATDLSSTPSEQDLMNLPLTTEDLAALHDDLKTRGFSDEELSAMQTRVQSDAGMTWGDMMHEVKQKVAGTKKAASSTQTAEESNASELEGETKTSSSSSDTKEKTAAKDISNDDKVQLLSLFGKLGFTPTESQSMVDSLAKGETDSVFAAVDAKIAAMASDSSVSLDSKELTTLARTVGLSEDAQSRVASLVGTASTSEGFSQQGIATALGLVKNELSAKLAQENQALAEFRESASQVLTKAWQRESGQKNADRHQDDVARKAGQAVAMGAGKDDGKSETPSAIKSGINLLGDVPAAGQGVGDSSQSSSASSSTTASGQTLAGQTASASHQTQSATTTTTGQASAESTAAQQLADKHAAAMSAGSNGDAMAFAGGHQGTGTGNGSTSQNGQDVWGDFWSKVRVDKSTTTAKTSTAQTATSQTMAAMDSIKTATTSLTGKTYDPALAARAARQLETGLLRNVGQDAKQLTLKLNPEELGKLSVTLTVKDKEIKAVIAADNTDTATMLQDQAAHIKKTLEDQGFKVTKLEVQTGVAQDRQNAWQGTDQHNQAREQRQAMDRMRSSWRMSQQGESGLSGDQTGIVPGALTSSASGLDLFA